MGSYAAAAFYCMCNPNSNKHIEQPDLNPDRRRRRRSGRNLGNDVCGRNSRASIKIRLEFVFLGHVRFPTREAQVFVYRFGSLHFGGQCHVRFHDLNVW